MVKGNDHVNGLEKLCEYRGEIFNSGGSPAILLSGEIIPDKFWETISSQSPSGYIIGVGCGTVFSMMQAFSDQTPPQGILMVDSAALVVLAGKIINRSLRYYDRWEDFVECFLYGGWRNLERDVIDTEQNPALKAFWRLDETHRVLYQKLDELNRPTIQEWLVSGIEGKLFDHADHRDTYPLRIIMYHYSALHELAQRGQIVCIWADILDPQLIELVAELPRFGQSTNVIYVSNIANFISRGDNRQLETANEKMRQLDALTKKPKNNIFIYTSNRLSSRLNAQFTAPQYTQL